MRKIPLLGLSVSLLLVAVLLVATLPMVAVATSTPMLTWGEVTLDGSVAPVGTTVDVYVGADTAASGSFTVATAGQYGAIQVWADDSRYGEALTYKVDGFVATKQGPDTGVFGLANQEVDLVAVSGDQTQYTLTVTVSPVGAGTVDTAPAQPSGGYIEDTVVTLTATANSGNIFIGWSGVDSSDGNTATITMNSAKMVTASFQVADPDTIIIPLAPGWNVISTPIWLDDDADQTRDILSEGYEGYRWSGTSWKTLSKSYTWEPLEAFYVKAATASFKPMVSEDLMELPNVRKLSSNKWALIGSSPADGASPMAIDDVLAGLNNNYVNVFIPGSGESCTVGDCDGNDLAAFSGAWVFVGGEKTRTIVGSYFTPIAQ